MAEENNITSRVFISYSRKDKEFVRKLNNALDASSVEAWVDWEGIELAADWMETITSAIQKSDAFLFVISPDSLASSVCASELELALQNSKKLIPILFREPAKDSQMHEKLAATNWVYLREQDNFEETIPRLIDAVNTDLEWIHQHTRLLERATEWEQKNKNSSFLLRGTDLDEAEQWSAEATAGPNRHVLALHAEYIHESRRSAVRGQRIQLVVVSILLVASVLFGIYALIQQGFAQENALAEQAARIEAVANEKRAIEQGEIAKNNQILAEEREEEAKAQRSAALSEIYQNQSGGLGISTILAVDSSQRKNDFNRAENLIRENLSILPVPVKPEEPMAHTDAIWNIEWSSKKDSFVSSSSDGRACVWKLKDGQLLYCTPPQGAIIYDAVFTPDGKYLITASADKSVRFWNAANGKPTKYRFDYSGKIWDLDVSPNGHYLAVARGDNITTIIDLNKLDFPNLFLNFKHVGGSSSVKFSEDGKWLVIGTSKGVSKIWQVDSRPDLFDGPYHPTSAYLALAISPNGTWIATGGSDSLVKVTKSTEGLPKYTPLLHEDWVEDIAFSPDSSWFVTGSDDNKVRIFDTVSGMEIKRMEHYSFVQEVEVSPNGQWIASTGYDRIVRVWEVASGAKMLEFPLNGIGSELAFSQDGNHLVAADESGYIGIMDISSLSARLNAISFPEFAHNAVFSPDGESLAVNTDDQNVWLLTMEQALSTTDGTDGNIILTADSLTYDMSISSDSRKVAVVENNSFDDDFNKGIVKDIGGAFEYDLHHTGDDVAVNGIAFMPKSDIVFTAGNNNRVIGWDVESGEKKIGLQNTGTVYSIAIHPGGTWLAAGLDNNVAIWDLSTRKPLSNLTQIGSIIRTAFSHNGKWLASASSDGTVYLWSIEGESFNLSVVFSPNIVIEALDFSPDDQLLAGGSEQTVLLWSTGTGEEVARLPHVDMVTSVSFSADGNLLATVSRKVVEIWDVTYIKQIPNHELISEACSRLANNLSRGEWKNLFGDEVYFKVCPNLPVWDE